jgi:mannosyl-oligosaccharide alpha-1,3-glucosidase
MLLSLGISGIPFVGADIPGFYGNSTDEIFVKFYQLGTFFPFMRAHSHKEPRNREPYLQSELVQRTIKDSVFLRYDLIHYLYT